MKSYLLILFFVLAGAFHYNAFSQCENWNDSDRKAQGEEAHSIYRGALESGDYNIAFEYWQTAYGIAPAADGRRAAHYLDGITIYDNKYENATTEEEKKEYSDWVLRLYDEAAYCYENQAIVIDGCADESCYNSEAGYYLGRKAYKMDNKFKSPIDEIFLTSKKAMKLSGNKTEYIVFGPLSKGLVSQFKEGNIEIEEARELHKQMVDIIEYNIEQGGDYVASYEWALNTVDNRIKTIENDLYDCEYFIEKYVPEYEADKENGETIERIYRLLKARKCSDDLPIMQELEAKYAEYVEEYNRLQMLELAKTNPGVAASLAYDEGRFADAVKHYENAIEQADTDDKKADYYFNMASIQGRRLNQYARARDNARKAAQLRPNWGKPYMLIGDLYATTSRDCGDAWQQRLAILAAIDKYAYARQIDAEERDNANRRIANYQDSMPLKDQAFMRGLTEGDKVKVECWIGEIVTLRF